jgi:hypothetical protein
MPVEIWTPPRPPDDITIYIDETYFDMNSGLIQVGLPVPYGCKAGFEEAIAKLRADNPHVQIAEFKAGKVHAGNATVYGKFLQYVINIAGAVGEQTPLRPVISVESMKVSTGNEYDWVLRQVTGAFQKQGINNAPASNEFARQALWLWRYMKNICPQQVGNPFQIIVDEKYRDATECRSLKPVIMPHGMVVWWEHWKHLTSFLNTLLSNVKPRRWTPRITEFRFESSKNSLYLQAADLLANIFYNAMKFEKGIVNPNTKLKHDLFQSVMDGPLDPALLNDLAVTTRTDKNGVQHECLVVSGDSLKGKMVLSP